MDAIEAQTAEGKLLTPDLGGSASTWEVGDALAQRVRERAGRVTAQTS
jgi:isocitrate/isopropylmalate dehydrogenase